MANTLEKKDVKRTWLNIKTDIYNDMMAIRKFTEANPQYIGHLDIDDQMEKALIATLSMIKEKIGIDYYVKRNN